MAEDPEKALAAMPSDGSLAKAAAVPLPALGEESLQGPQPRFLDADSRKTSSLDQLPDSLAIANSTTALGGNRDASSLAEDGQVPAKAAKSTKKSPWFIAIAALLALAIVVLAVMLPVYFKVLKPNQERSSATSAGSEGPSDNESTSAPEPSPTSLDSRTGGDGSRITTEDGETFTYNNQFGGYWYADPDDPYNDSARPNSWTAPLNESFDYETTKIWGVNLGGLFVLEPFISPALFQRYPGAVDEWDLSVMMAADTANGGLDQLEEHYRTFITERDVAEIAGAGLNYVRLPVPFWAIDVWPGEPFLERTSWPYIVRVLQWCRKYGLRVNLDLHTFPGSHNAYNHGGRFGVHNFMNGAMGLANAQRGLYYIQVFTEFVNQPEWRNVVTMFSIMNEPIVGTIGTAQLRAFYVESHRLMREITGFGEGQGPYMVIHDSFQGLTSFEGFMPGADRVAFDVHPYFAFQQAATVDPIDTGVGAGAGGTWPGAACDRFGAMMNNSRTNSGVTVAGEFSNAIQDCSLFLRGVGSSPDYQGDCTPWLDSSTWSEGTKAGVLAFASAQMDSLGDYFFWTWKIGASERGIIESPFWDYSLGLAEGWMPTDPRTVMGTCEALGRPPTPWSGTYQPYMIGGAGAGLPTDAGAFPWPPAALNDGNDVTLLPAYDTTSGALTFLPNIELTDSQGNPIPHGEQDGIPVPVPFDGCVYPDAWGSEGVPAPGACGGAPVPVVPVVPDVPVEDEVEVVPVVPEVVPVEPEVPVVPDVPAEPVVPTDPTVPEVPVV